jgi:hypothetical protein
MGLTVKPRLFVASSAEQLELAYAVQEGLEHDAETTVWSQGVFKLSKTALASLIDKLDEIDFGVFLLAPGDVTQLRDSNFATVRDNVIFELGLFVGRLGAEKCFLVAPMGVEDLRFPTDLLGLTPAFFDANRQDGNMVAAVGPACNRIRKIMKQFAPEQPDTQRLTLDTPHTDDGVSDENDCISIIQSWMGKRPSMDNTGVMKFDVVDRELGLKSGSARKYIKIAAIHWGYVVQREGLDTILLKQGPNDYMF